jgi:hypothetical protein
MKHLSILIIIALIAVSAAGAAETLNKEQSADIFHLLEEEKLARDVYTVLGERWNLRVFTNIASAEENHRSRVQKLADEYGLSYDYLPPGVFTDKGLQELYNKLVEQGLNHRTEALEVGRTVEIMDIEDLTAMLSRNPPDDVQAVMEELRRGSENHLAAFERQLR